MQDNLMKKYFLIQQDYESNKMNSNLKKKKEQQQERMNINKLNAKKVFLLIQQQKLDWSAVQTVFSYLKLLLLKLDGEDYIYWLKYLVKLVSLGYGSLVMNDNQLQRKLVQMFNHSLKSYMIDFTNKSFSYMIFQISIIADFIRSFPKIMYPYNKEFIQSTIKLSQFTSQNKDSQTKLNFILSILYLNFSKNIHIAGDQQLYKRFEHHIFNQIKKSQKQQKYQQNQILCQTLENLINIKTFKIKLQKQYFHNSKSFNKPTSY